jgi:hypothetical protein
VCPASYSATVGRTCLGDGSMWTTRPIGGARASRRVRGVGGDRGDPVGRGHPGCDPPGSR